MGADGPLALSGKQLCWPMIHIGPRNGGAGAALSWSCTRRRNVPRQRRPALEGESHIGHNETHRVGHHHRRTRSGGNIYSRRPRPDDATRLPGRRPLGEDDEPQKVFFLVLIRSRVRGTVEVNLQTRHGPGAAQDEKRTSRTTL